MKKSFGLLMLLALFLTSCQTQLKTARTAVTDASLRSVAVADLEVADERIIYTMEPSKDIQRAGLSNVKQAAEQEALTKHGNADVLLDPQYVITKKRTLFGSKISSITVSGRPAYYRNFRTLNDSVWTNPAFNGVAVQGKSAGQTNNNGFFAPKRSGKNGNKGFEAYVTLAAMFSTFSTSEDCCDGKEAFGYGALTSFGYRFSPYFYLGAGIGVTADTYDQNAFLPLYMDMRVNFSKRPKTFFFDYKVGYTLVDMMDECETDVFLAVGLGYTFGKLDLALQTTVQSIEKYECSYSTYYGCGGAAGEIVSFGISLGYKF